MGVQSARSLAAQGVGDATLAIEGVRNSDCTYDNRFKRYDGELQRHDEELQRLKNRDTELQQLQNRVTFLEGLLSRVLSMMQSGNIDAAEVEPHPSWSTRDSFRLTLFWPGCTDASKPWYLMGSLDDFCLTWAFVAFDNYLKKRVTSNVFTKLYPRHRVECPVCLRNSSHVTRRACSRAGIPLDE